VCEGEDELCFELKVKISRNNSEMRNKQQTATNKIFHVD
jgi:hypothetical protein